MTGTVFSIDIFGASNAYAQEIPSAVGLRGFYIAGHGEFDFSKHKVERMLSAGDLRPASYVEDRLRRALRLDEPAVDADGLFVHETEAA